MNEDNYYEQEIDLMELVRMLFRKWYIIVISVVVVLLAVVLYSSLTQSEGGYVAEKSFAVNIDKEYFTSAHPTIVENTMETAVTYAKSTDVISALNVYLNDNTNYTNYTDGYLNSVISVDVIDTKVYAARIRVNADTDDASRIIAESLFVVLDENIDQSINTIDGVSSWGEAQLVMVDDSGNPLLYISIGIILGGMVGVFLVFGLEFLDQTIKSPEDIEKKLKLRLLSTIPEIKDTGGKSNV